MGCMSVMAQLCSRQLWASTLPSFTSSSCITSASHGWCGVRTGRMGDRRPKPPAGCRSPPARHPSATQAAAARCGATASPAHTHTRCFSRRQGSAAAVHWNRVHSPVPGCRARCQPQAPASAGNSKKCATEMRGRTSRASGAGDLAGALLRAPRPLLGLAAAASGPPAHQECLAIRCET
jgi:hypothetical protein